MDRIFSSLATVFQLRLFRFKNEIDIYIELEFYILCGPFILINFSASEETQDNDMKGRSVIELLSSIPGFNMKRKRNSKKLSTAAQLEQTKEGCIDLETPDSILVQTNLRDLLNEQAFSSLPQLYQQKLVQLLPSIDRVSVNTPTKCLYK